MKAHIYEPKALPGVELGAGALYLGEPTEENKICDVMPGAYAKTRQDKTGMFLYTGMVERHTQRPQKPSI